METTDRDRYITVRAVTAATNAYTEWRAHIKNPDVGMAAALRAALPHMAPLIRADVFREMASDTVLAQVCQNLLEQVLPGILAQHRTDVLEEAAANRAGFCSRSPMCPVEAVHE